MCTFYDETIGRANCCSGASETQCVKCRGLRGATSQEREAADQLQGAATTLATEGVLDAAGALSSYKLPAI
jgi:hypothetical protein